MENRNQSPQTFVEEALPHLDALYRMAFRNLGDPALAEDVVQETFTEAWRSFHLYQPGTNCKAWLFRILFRVMGRVRVATRRAGEVDLDSVSPASLAVAPDANQRLERRHILGIVRSMPDNYRTVLVLADVEGLRYREIAELLGIPVGTVMSRLNRARKLLREKFSQDENTSRTA